MPELQPDSQPQPPGSALDWGDGWLQSDAHAQTDVVNRLRAAKPHTPDAASTGIGTTDLSIKPVRFGGYEILERVGRGGMGAVYRARQINLGRVVALKVIAPGSWDDSAARVRFEREFQALAGIEHPNIVPVYDAGTWDGYPYFAMKYVPGGALNKHLDRFREDPTATARLMAKVARAVHRLHQTNILHRDLKPHNILLGEADEPLVADFGLVKKLGEDSDASVTGAPMGTRQYMSPEQTWAQKTDYTPACDVWALGVVLYELLAGVRPFTSPDVVELSIEIRTATPKSIGEINPAAPGRLAAIAHRCLAKPPADRYPTAAAVADDLEAWLAGGEDIVPLPPPAPPGRKWVKVAVGVATAGLLAILLLAAGGAFAPQPPAPPAPDPEPAPPPAAPPPRATAPGGQGNMAQRLRAGETVTLIGEKGLPVVPYPEPGTVGGAFSTATAGCCTLFTNHWARVELVPEDIPLPVQLEADVAIVGGTPRIASAGFYVGRRSWPGPVPQETFAHVGLELINAGVRPVYHGSRNYQVWALPAGVPGVPGQYSSDLRLGPPGPPQLRPLPPLDPAVKDNETPWRRLRVILDPTEITCSWDGESFPVVSGAPLLGHHLRGAPEPPGFRAPGRTPFTGGIGLSMFASGTAAYRNVTVSPVRTP